MLRSRTLHLRRFVLQHVEGHPADIARLTAERFQISRSAVSRHLREMADEGLLSLEGQKRGRRYTLRTLDQVEIETPTESLQEHVPWEEHLRPRLREVADNVQQICQYGFTEMLNNAIDHSGADRVRLGMIRTAESIQLWVRDEGIGIFRKIKDACGLANEHEAILELTKGKLTTDPENHTGQGIFFTSRVFDEFQILSRGLLFHHESPDDDWLVEPDETFLGGTAVLMKISSDSETTLNGVFDQFSSGPEDYSFRKTHVPLKLARYGDERLVSRSQARRVLSHFEKFEEVLLDFDGVDFIGQAFADEIFRVFRRKQPHVQVVAVRTNGQVQAMINRALSHKG